MWPDENEVEEDIKHENVLQSMLGSRSALWHKPLGQLKGLWTSEKQKLSLTFCYTRPARRAYGKKTDPTKPTNKTNITLVTQFKHEGRSAHGFSFYRMKDTFCVFFPTVVIIAFFTAWQQRVEGRGNSVRLSLRLQTGIRLQTCSMSECEDVKGDSNPSRIRCAVW